MSNIPDWLTGVGENEREILLVYDFDKDAFMKIDEAGLKEIGMQGEGLAGCLKAIEELKNPRPPPSVTSSSGQAPPSASGPAAARADPGPLPVGIENQAATCYLNALMQALYNVTYFRRMIYKMTVKVGTKPSESIALALQRLFFNLEMAQEWTSTAELTDAFGWDSGRLGVHQDIHEMLRILLDELEAQLKGTEQEGTIEKMMGGRKQCATHCLDDDRVKRTEEEFLDLELTVKGKATLEESINFMCSTEKLDFKREFDNPDGTTSKNDAETRISLKKMPPILLCHPNRLTFNPTTYQAETINDRWTFPNEVDVAPYLSETSDQVRSAKASAVRRDRADEREGDGDEEEGMVRNNSIAIASDDSTSYVLNSVVIHDGGAAFGHYYSICRQGDRWIKLNDRVVSEVSQQEMEKLAFAGKVTTTDYLGTREAQSTTKCAMLVYINKSLIEKLIFKIDPENLPRYLHAGLAEQQHNKRRGGGGGGGRPSDLTFSCLGISTDPTYLHDFSHKDKCQDLTVDVDATVQDLADAAHKFYKVPANKIVRCWFYHESYNCGYENEPALYHKPHEKLYDGGYRTLAGISKYHRKMVFCNVVDPDSTDPFEIKTCKLLHAMEYNEVDGKISFSGVYESADEFIDRYDVLGKNTGLPKAVYQNNRVLVKDVNTHNMSLLHGGTQLIVCPFGTNKETISQTLDVMYNSLDVTVYRLNEDGQGDELFQLQVTEKMQYGAVQEKILETLKLRAKAEGLATPGELRDGVPEDPEFIGLRRYDSNSDTPYRLLEPRKQGYYKTAVNVKDLCETGFGMVARLCYNVLPTTITKIEKNWLECVFAVGEVRMEYFYIDLSKVSKTWSTVFNQVRERFPDRFPAGSKKDLRCITLYQHTRVNNSYSNPEAPNPGAEGNWDNVIYVFDELPVRTAEDVDMTMDDGEERPLKRMDVVNICRKVSTHEDFHGTPTSVYVNGKDTATTLVKKIVDKLEVPVDQRDNALKHWRVLFRDSISKTTFLKPDEEVYPTIKGYTGTPVQAYSRFLLVDRYQNSARSNKKGKSTSPGKRAPAPMEGIKIKSQKQRDADAARASESPQRTDGDSNKGSPAKDADGAPKS